MEKTSPQNANLIADPTEIQGFIVGKSSDPFYHVQRTFTPNSTLKKYLQQKRPEKVTEEKDNYTLFEILKHIKDIVEEEHLYDDRNPCVIICNKELEEALQVRSLLTSDTIEIARRQIKLTEESYNTLRGIDEPTTVPHTAHVDTLYVPAWASEDSIAIKAARNTRLSFGIDDRWKTTPKLTTFLKQHNPKINDDITYNFEDILLTVMDYLVAKAEITFDCRHEKVVHLTGTELEDIFEVNIADLSQIISLIQYNLIQPDPIEERMQAFKQNFPKMIRYLAHLNEQGQQN